MTAIPTNRTTANSPSEHVSDHNILHHFNNEHPTDPSAHIGTYVRSYVVTGYGATGDGVTDDTAAVQALIDLVGGSNPVEIYFPVGVYILSGLKLRSNITLRGAGSGGYGLSTNYATRCSVLKLKASSSLPIIADFDTSTFVYSVSIRDLQFDGNKANQSVARHGIQLYDDVSGTDPLWTIRDCLILNCKGDGIKIGTFRRGNRVLNCQVYGCDQNGVTLGSTDNTVAQTIVGSSGNYGVSITAGLQHVVGCDVFSNLVGINIAAGVAGVMVTNNGIDRNLRQAIFCVGSRNVIAGNSFVSNSQESNGGYATIDFDYPNFVAAGNIVSNNTFWSDGTLTNKPDYSVRHNLPIVASGNTFGSPAPHTTGAFIQPTLAVILERSQGVQDGADLSFGTTSGSKLGTTTSQKIGFWNATPVIQQATTADLLALLQTLGLAGAGTPSDAAAGTQALRAIGTTATTAAAGNDSRLSDTRTPTNLTVTDAKVAVAAAISPAKIDDLRPTGAIAQTHTRIVTVSDLAALSTGRLSLVAIYLPAGVTVNSISFLSRTTPAGTPTNQWFALLNNAASPVLLRQTADDTTTAWAANTVKTLALSSSFVTTYSGLHYVGIMVAAATVPTLTGVSLVSGVFGALTPLVYGTSTTGLTTPASFTSPASAPTASTIVPYAYVS